MKRCAFVHCLLLVALFAVAFPTIAQEKLPPATNLVRIEAEPKRIDLKTPFEYSQLLLTGILDSGERIDVTRLAKIKVPANVVKVSERGQVRPVADGKGTLIASVGAQQVKIPLKISGQTVEHPVSFIQDVMPLLSRVGCNQGTCHGGAQGRNGFQLSLRGYDPIFDHLTLTDDVQGRRFNRAAPERSLMLLKPAGGVPHVGGVLCQPGEPSYELLKLWIAQGVKFDPERPRASRIEIHPVSPVLPIPGAKQQLIVLATYGDGKVRDVSAEAFIESSNIEVATVDKQGLVTAVRRGETAMLARYEGNYAAASLIVMGDRSGFAWQETPTHNWIDPLVYDKLKQVRVQPSGLCSDTDFLRRIYLDVTGLPPRPDEVRAFLADPRPTKDKRDALIDQLVGNPEYVEHWTNKWADLLQVNRKFLGDKGAVAFRQWIKDAVTANIPYDKFAHDILTAKGSNLANPPASYFKILREPDVAMENTTHLFLGVRFNCNKCHDHPFERWTQDQYYQLSSFFAQVSHQEDPKYKGQKLGGTAVKGAAPLVELIDDTNKSEVTHLRTGATVAAKFPYTHSDLAPPTASRREQLARWATSRENVYFAKSFVNRIWGYLLGVGLIEPLDDIRAGNPPTNPQLLDRLAKEFIAGGFNVQELIRTICKSRTYQHAIETNEWNQDDEVNYSHALARRLPAEVLYDAIHRAAGSKSKLPGLPPGSRAAQTLDSNVPVPGGFLDLFGRPPRESACECERSSGMMLGPVLTLINGPVLADALRDPNNRINKLLETEKDDAKVVEEIYLTTLCRLPTRQELEVAVKALQGNESEFRAAQAEQRKRAADLAEYETTLPAAQARWEEEMKNTPTWTVLEPTKLTAEAGARLTKLADGSIFADGPNSTPETYTIVAKTDLKSITGLRLDALADSGLPGGGPGRYQAGNFVLSDFKVTVKKAEGADKARPVVLQKPQATYAQAGFEIAKAIDNSLNTGWGISGGTGRDQAAVFELKDMAGFEEGTVFTFTLVQKHSVPDYNLGKFRLSATTMSPPLRLKSLDKDLARIIQLPADQRSDAEKKQLSDHYRSIDSDLALLQRAIADFTLAPNARALGAQDLTWALMNSPAFLFNH